VETIPKREKSRLRTIWDCFQEQRRIQAEKGILVAYPIAASLLAVSVTRVDELARAGTIERYDFQGHRFVTELSLLAYAKTERKAGRPPKGFVKAGTLAGAFSQAKAILKK
jgi:hypothetical protein